LKWALLAAWVPATFWVHCLVHEGSHALMLHAFGCTGVRLHLWPSRAPDGRWMWASIDAFPPPGRALTLAQTAATFFAPVVAELAWMVVALGVAVVWPWAGLEAASALVDIGTWCTGMIRRRAGTDGQRVLEALR
jgi:hypothetical protein